MRRITFTNTRGESVVLYNSAPFLITKLEGIGTPPADIHTQRSPYQDGVTYLDSYLEPRSVTIEGAVMGKSRAEVFSLRQTLARVLNPKWGPGILRYEYDGGVKEIQAVADGAPVFPDQYGETYQVFLLSLLCPSPFWLDTFTTSREMSYIMGGFGFVLRLPASFARRSFRRAFQNEGDVETPVKIAFKGPAQNPTVMNNTTGEFIRVKRELGDNDILYIDTSFGNKRVEIRRENGEVENAFHYVDLASTFFQLAVGENILEYNSGNDSTKTRVTIKYKNRYVGV
ncbi:phage tail family protein [Brevibacillus borstelensis]|uniref:phage tail family protein n=1 Tax=Brevibacillus borstelensis TaxID=45462 RepID=UPI0030C5D11F